MIAASVAAFLFGYVTAELYNGLWDLEEQADDLNTRVLTLELWREQGKVRRVTRAPKVPRG